MFYLFLQNLLTCLLTPFYIKSSRSLDPFSICLSVDHELRLLFFCHLFLSLQSNQHHGWILQSQLSSFKITLLPAAYSHHDTYYTAWNLLGRRCETQKPKISHTNSTSSTNKSMHIRSRMLLLFYCFKTDFFFSMILVLAVYDWALIEEHDQNDCLLTLQ